MFNVFPPAPIFAHDVARFKCGGMKVDDLGKSK